MTRPAYPLPPLSGTHAAWRPRRARRQRSPRRAISLLEVTAGAATLAVLLTIVVQLFAQVRQHARRAEDRAAMLRMAENLMEQCTAAPWEEISDDSIANLKLPAEATHRWPGVTLKGEVRESSDGEQAKKVMLTLTPASNAGERPVRLTTWVYRATENNAR